MQGRDISPSFTYLYIKYLFGVLLQQQQQLKKKKKKDISQFSSILTKAETMPVFPRNNKKIVVGDHESDIASPKKPRKLGGAKTMPFILGKTFPSLPPIFIDVAICVK